MILVSRLAIVGANLAVTLMLASSAAADERDSRLTMKISAGPEMRSFREIAIDGGCVTIGLGGHRGIFYGLAVARGLFGGTRGGLFVQNFSAGSDLLFAVGRAHMGFGPAATFVFIRRATTGNYVATLGGGLEGVVEVDLLQDEITEPDARVRRLGSLFLSSRGGVHGLFNVHAAMFSASLALGWRIH